jgi:hypothetical protein
MIIALRRVLLAIRILLHSYAKVNGTFCIHFMQPFHFRPCLTSVHAELPEKDAFIIGSKVSTLWLF